jgi:hypothetical protein
MDSKLKLFPAMALYCLAAMMCARLMAQQHTDTEKAPKHKDLIWSPPNVDTPLRSIVALPPCDVSEVLRKAGVRALELTTNLENFTAQERIEYVRRDQTAFPEEYDDSVFDYVFAFEQSGGNHFSREYRTPAKGGHMFAASGQDTGQVALALIFLPSLQTDYEMSCEGLDKWNGQLAWVIHFQQRKDKPGRTLQFRTEEGPSFAMLKGRAWISMENSQILHLETNLMHAVPSLNLQSGAAAIDYAPVRVESKKLEFWLPQRVEAYWEIANRRIILFHTYTNFQLFTVATEEKVEKPKE